MVAVHFTAPAFDNFKPKWQTGLNVRGEGISWTALLKSWPQSSSTTSKLTVMSVSTEHFGQLGFN